MVGIQEVYNFYFHFPEKKCKCKHVIYSRLLYIFVTWCIVLCYSLVPFAVVFIGSTLFALQQLSGINAVFYFSSTVFKSAGVPSDMANIFVGISNLLGNTYLLLHLLFSFQSTSQLYGSRNVNL